MTLFLGLLAALTSPVLAGEIVVAVSTPVRVAIDGQFLDLPEDSMTFNAPNLAGGIHRIEAHTMFGRLIAGLDVDVPLDQQVRVKYQRKKLLVLGSGPLPASTVASPVGSEVQVSEGGETVTVRAATDITNITTGKSTTTISSSAGGLNVSISVTDEGVSGETFMEEGGDEMMTDPALGCSMLSEPSHLDLIDAVKAATFGSDQVDVLRTAAVHNCFTCRQVVDLVAPISHSSDKVAAVKAVAHHVTDPENAHTLEKAFTFSSDKEDVRALFR